MLALCQYQLDEDASALANIQTAKRLGVQTDGGLPQVLTYHEGMLLLRAGRYERALETLQPLASAGVEDENLELALGMGVLLLHPNEVPAKESPARAVVMRAGRAERHYMAKAFAAARRDYAALVAEAPTRPNVHYAYGRFLLATEDLDSGIQEFLKEIEAHPEHVRARMQVAAARYRVDSAAGLPFAQDVVRLAPDYPFGHYLLGLLYFDTGDIARAIPALEDRGAHAAGRGAVPVRARQRLREGGPRGRGRASARGLHSTQAGPSRRMMRAVTRCGVSTSTRQRVRRSETESCLQLDRRARRGLPALRRSARSGCRPACSSG